MAVKNKKIEIGIKILCIYYIFWVIFIIVFKMSFSLNNLLITSRINLIPFYHDNQVSLKIILDEMISNIIIFIPLGTIIKSILYDETPRKYIAIVISIPLMIEFMQYILSIGIFDITDLINNSMGIILGMLFYDFLMKRFSSKLKLDKLIFWCGWVGAILLSIILIVVLFKNN